MNVHHMTLAGRAFHLERVAIEMMIMFERLDERGWV